MRNIMDAAAKPALDVKVLILETITQGKYRPVELFEALRPKASDSQVKDALAALVEAQLVVVTPDRYVVKK